LQKTYALHALHFEESEETQNIAMSFIITQSVIFTVDIYWIDLHHYTGNKSSQRGPKKREQ